MKKFVCILMALLSVAVVFACSREPEYKNPISKEQLSEFLREKQYISTSPITFKFSLNYDSTTYEDLRSEDNLATKKNSHKTFRFRSIRLRQRNGRRRPTLQIQRKVAGKHYIPFYHGICQRIGNPTRIDCVYRQ